MLDVADLIVSKLRNDLAHILVDERDDVLHYLRDRLVIVRQLGQLHEFLRCRASGVEELILRQREAGERIIVADDGLDLEEHAVLGEVGEVFD